MIITLLKIYLFLELIFQLFKEGKAVSKKDWPQATYRLLGVTQMALIIIFI